MQGAGYRHGHDPLQPPPRDGRPLGPPQKAGRVCAGGGGLSATMDLATSEAVVRVTVFAASLALFAVVEAVSPRRRRTVPRRHRWTGNLGLVVVDTILVRAVPFLSAVAMAGLAETQGWGLLRTLGPLPIAASIAASVVLLDLAVYAQHRLFHTLPVLWWVHRVHHTDPELDATTGVRFHPVEIMLSATFKV